MKNTHIISKQLSSEGVSGGPYHIFRREKDDGEVMKARRSMELSGKSRKGYGMECLHTEGITVKIMLPRK